MADIRLALRTLRRTPVFTVVAVLSLALGIGANTAIFSLLDQVLLRSLPVRDPARLVVVHLSEYLPGMAMADNRETVLSYPLYRDLRDRGGAVFDGLVARASAPVSLSDGTGAAEPGRAELVSGNLFQVLGVGAALGRVLQPSDDGAAGANPVVVVSEAYWQKRFGGSRSVLDRKIVVNGHPMIVVGVAARTYRGLISGSTPEVFVPISSKREITPTWDGLEDRGAAWLTVVGRLKPGVAVETARAASRTLFRPILEEWIAATPAFGEKAREYIRHVQLDLLPASQGVNELRREFQSALLALMGMVGLVLLIACANVAGLMTARAAGRRREVAIRLAIGASRWSLVRQLLTESLVLAAAGGLLGLLVGRVTVQGLVALMGSDMDGVLSAAVDGRVLAFTAVLSVATGVLFGLVPALQATSARVTTALKEQAAGSLSGAGPARFRRLLVVAQVALSMLLLVAAGLFGRSVLNLLRVNPGFTPDRVLTFSIDPTLQGYPAARVHDIYRQVAQQLALMPGVVSTGGANPGPLTHSTRAGNITVEGYAAADDEDEAGATFQGVSEGYFRTIGVTVTAGRDLAEADLVSTRRVVLVNEAFVRKYARGRSALGLHVTPGGGPKVVPDREIVGIVRDFAHDDLRQEVRPTIFMPYTQEERPDALRFYVRTARGGTDLAPAIRRMVARIDATVAVGEMKAMEDQVRDATGTDRLIAVLAVAFAFLATLLATVGLYGVIAYTVARRTSEIGLRVALGATPWNVQTLVMSEVLGLLGAGLAIGIPGAVAASRLVRAQLFGVGAGDPAVFVGGAAGLALVALLAGLLPARRAAAIDPTRALRQE
jgi:predicted permease